MLGVRTNICTFCQPVVSQHASPVLTPSSQRARPRPRILSPTPRRNTINRPHVQITSPTPVHPQRSAAARAPPRHFNSSPDLDVGYRCEKTEHNPLKPKHDFIDEHGRMHPVCNECRQSDPQRLLNEISDNESNDSSTSSASSPLPAGTRGRFRLSGRLLAPPPRFPSLSPVPLNQMPVRPNQSVVDFALPHMWSDSVERVVSKFRDTLQQIVYSACPTCLRFHQFSQPWQVNHCAHCKKQRRLGRKSRFGGDNDMDPGPVSRS